MTGGPEGAEKRGKTRAGARSDTVIGATPEEYGVRAHLRVLEDMELSPGEREAILHANARKLLKLS
jgi:predicted TIM-barrel fold metal-dependent hydrolase